jgi:hypothetical protein
MVRIGVLARGVALCITAPLSNMSVGNCSSNNNNINISNVSRLRVQTGVHERHLLEYKSELIRF